MPHCPSGLAAFRSGGARKTFISVMEDAYRNASSAGLDAFIGGTAKRGLQGVDYLYCGCRIGCPPDAGRHNGYGLCVHHVCHSGIVP